MDLSKIQLEHLRFVGVTYIVYYCFNPWLLFLLKRVVGKLYSDVLFNFDLWINVLPFAEQLKDWYDNHGDDNYEAPAEVKVWTKFYNQSLVHGIISK